MEGEKLSDQLRRAIDDSEMSRNRICDLIGINKAAMSRFMTGKRGLSLETVDRVCALLRLKLVPETQSPGMATRNRR